MASTYTFPSGQNSARAQALVPYSGGLLLPTIYGTGAFSASLAASGNTLTALSLNAPASGQGWSAAAVDQSGNAYLAPLLSGYGEKLPSQHLVTLPQSKSWTGVAVPTSGAGSGTAYFQASDGTLAYDTVTVSVGFGELSRGLVTDGTSLYTTLPASSHLGILALSTAASGTITKVSTPMTMPACLAGSASGVAVAGWSPSTLSHGANQMAASPAAPSTIAAAVQASTNSVMLITGTEPAWSIAQTVSGTGAPSAFAWTPNGEQIITCDTTNGKVEVFSLQNLQLVSSQTLSLAGASKVAVTPDSQWALVCQPAQNEVSIYQNAANVWSLSQTVSGIQNASCALALSPTSIVIGASGSLVWLSYAETWSVQARVTGFGSTPTSLATDGNGNVFAVGGGYLAAATTAGIVAQTTVGATPNDIAYVNNTIMVLEGGALAAYWLHGSTLVDAVSNTAIPTSGTSIGLTYESVWICTSTEIAQFQIRRPFTVASVKFGILSLYKSGTWTTTNLGAGVAPSAITFDPSGNAWCCSAENDLFEISAAGAILSHTTVAPYTGQPSGTPIGLSALLWNNGHLYAASSLCGALIEIQ